MFDKVKAARNVGVGAAVLVPLLADLLGIEVQVGDSIEDTVGAIFMALIPIGLGVFAAWKRRERTGYGSTVAVDTTGVGPATGVLSSEPPHRQGGPQEPIRYNGRP